MGATAGGGVGAAGTMLGAADVVGVAGGTLGATAVVGGADVAVAALGVAAVVGAAGAAAGFDTVTGVGDAGAGPPLQPTASAAAKSANPVVYTARIRFAISVLPISDGAPSSRMIAADSVCPFLRVRIALQRRRLALRRDMRAHILIGSRHIAVDMQVIARHNLLHISERLVHIISNAPRL